MATLTLNDSRNIDDIKYPCFAAVASGGTTAQSNTGGDPTATWTTRTLPSTQNWNGVCGGQNRFVAVSEANGGGAGTVGAISWDGIIWMPTVLPASAVWKAVAYGGGRFVAIARGSTNTAYSIDGRVWTAGGALPSSANWDKIVFGSGNFSVVATGTSNAAAYSSDGGASWNSATLPSSGDWEALAYGGNSKLIAIAKNSANAALSTNDGQTWSSISMFSSQNWQALASNGSGTWVAVAYNSNKSCYSTNDGTSWTEVNLSTTANWNIILWSPVYNLNSIQISGYFYVIASGSATANYSATGTSWSTDTLNSGSWTSACAVDALNYDTLVIQNGATITCDTDQKRAWRTITITNGKLKVRNASTSQGIRFLMGRNVASTTASTITPYGLGTLDVEGELIELGEGDGTADQEFTHWSTDYLPCVFVEKSPGSASEENPEDRFDIWFNVAQDSRNVSVNRAPFANNMSAAKDGKLGRFFTQGVATRSPEYAWHQQLKDYFTATLTFGDGTNGAVVPNGCKVFVPNIAFIEETPMYWLDRFSSCLVDTQYSGTALCECVTFGTAFGFSGVAPTKLDFENVFLSSGTNAHTFTKSLDVSLVNIGLNHNPTPFYPYPSTNVVGLVSGFPTNSFNLTYLTGAYIRNLCMCRSSEGYAYGTNLGTLNITYCSELDVDGITVYELNVGYLGGSGSYTLAFDFVSASTILNCSMLGGTWRIQNCYGTTFDGYEYSMSIEGLGARMFAGTVAPYGVKCDRNGVAWQDGTDYYVRPTFYRDPGAVLLGNYDDTYHIRPWTPNRKPSSHAFPQRIWWRLNTSQQITFAFSTFALPTAASNPYRVYAHSNGSLTEDQIVASPEFSAQGTASPLVLTGLTNGTPYYCVFRKYYSADSDDYDQTTKIRIVPRATITRGNLLLQTATLDNQTSWPRTNCPVTANQTSLPGYQPFDVSATNAADRLEPSAPGGYIQQTVTVPSAEDTFTFSVALAAIEDTEIEIRIQASGTSDVTQTLTLKPKWQLATVTILKPAGTTSVVCRIGGNAAFTSGKFAWAYGAGLWNSATPSITNINTTSAVSNANFTSTLFGWDWRNRQILHFSAASTSANVPTLYLFAHIGSTHDFTNSTDNLLARTVFYSTSCSFINNTECNFKNFSLHAENYNDSGYTQDYLYHWYISNCTDCNFIGFDDNGVSCSERLAYMTANTNLLFHNIRFRDQIWYPHYWSATYAGYPVGGPNDNVGIKCQNFYNDNGNYTPGILSSLKGMIVRNVRGGYPGPTPYNTYPSQNVGIGGYRVWTSVFDTDFFEVSTGTGVGLLMLRMNASERGADGFVTFTGSCGFDASGKLYFWGTDGEAVFKLPYKCQGITAFQNVDPIYYHVGTTDTTNATRIARPPWLRVQYRIDGGTWTDLTAANLSGETLPASFDFEIKMSVKNTSLWLEFDSKTANDFTLDTTVGDSASPTKTAIVREVAMFPGSSTNGMIRIDTLTGPAWADNDYLYQGSTQIARTNAAAAPDVYWPKSTGYIDALDIATEYDEDVVYPITPANVELTGLVAGTEVHAYLGTDPATATEIGSGIESSGTSFTFEQDYAGQDGYIVLIKPGYKVLTLPITFETTDVSIPVIQNADLGYLNPVGP